MSRTHLTPILGDTNVIITMEGVLRLRAEESSVCVRESQTRGQLFPLSKSWICNNDVAGLEEDNHNDTTLIEVPSGRDSGSSGWSLKRRNRPQSLAVQPLDSQPLGSQSIGNAEIEHPNMTSQDSVDNCSFDVDEAPVFDRSESTVDSISELTFHRLKLINGDWTSLPDNSVDVSSGTIRKTHQSSSENDNINGENETEQLTAKKPSYLGLACSISGYSGITTYDSKLREGFRSRDSSPGSRLIGNEPNCADFRSSKNCGVSSKNNSISPLAMDRPDACSHVDKDCRVVSFGETQNALRTCQAYFESDKHVPIHSSSEINSFRDSQKRISQTPTCRETKFDRSATSFSSNGSYNAVRRNNSHNDNNILDDVQIRIDNQSFNLSSEKSFIQQRVERLYGPGALAQGFFFKRLSNSPNDSTVNKSSNNHDTLIDNANVEESLKNLPVLRHLRPEFRAQLPVVSARKATDGSEKVGKPLESSLLTAKKDAKSSSSLPPIKASDFNVLKSSTVVTSIPDHQPAAPAVVLPVLERSESTASITEVLKSNHESQKEEKDGHYFLQLLKAEIERLLKLASSAEKELESGEQLPEEAAGKLRSAAGKAKLLATQKMQQFEGLCQKNINQIPGEEFPTTNEDLAGFWDMVMLQVVQVNHLFEHLEKLKSSQWQEIPQVKSPSAQSQNGNNGPKRRPRLPYKQKATSNDEANQAARVGRELARRQMMQERRKAMKSQVQQPVEIFAPKT